MKLSDKVITTIQTAGFIGALAALPFMHGLPQLLFATGFAVHFAGDLFRLDKDGVINMKEFFKKLLAKAQEFVKLGPWLQYVALQIGLIPGLSPEVVTAAATASVLAFTLRNARNLGPNDPKLRQLLAYVGYPLMVAGAFAHHPAVLFVGGALVMTEMIYTLIYP